MLNDKDGRVKENGERWSWLTLERCTSQVRCSFPTVCLIIASRMFLQFKKRKPNADDADRLSVESPLIFTDIFDRRLSTQNRRHLRPSFVFIVFTRISASGFELQRTVKVALLTENTLTFYKVNTYLTNAV